MIRRVSLVVAWLTANLVVVPLGALYFLVDLEAFITLAKDAIGLPIQWHTVESWQWYFLYILSLLYISIGLAGLYFLRRAFINFARGELLNVANSRDLRRFSILLFIQAAFKPVHLAIASVLLSLNHPTEQKMLTLSFGPGALRAIAVALILWVLSALLVEGSKLQAENRQFV
jgi:hypothetical protein